MANRRADLAPILQQLHWLPVKGRVEFKVLCVIFKLIYHNELAPQYLTELIGLCTSPIFVLKAVMELNLIILRFVHLLARHMVIALFLSMLLAYGISFQ